MQSAARHYLAGIVKSERAGERSFRHACSMPMTGVHSNPGR